MDNLNVISFNDKRKELEERAAMKAAALSRDNSLFETSRDSSDDITAFHVFKNLADDNWTVYTPSSVPFIVFFTEEDARKQARDLNRLVASDKALPYTNTNPKSYA